MLVDSGGQCIATGKNESWLQLRCGNLVSWDDFPMPKMETMEKSSKFCDPETGWLMFWLSNVNTI